MPEPKLEPPVREGAPEQAPERTLEELRSTTESIRKEIESLRQTVESLKTEKAEKYAEVLKELVRGWDNVFMCLDKECSARVRESCGWYYARLDGPEVISTEVMKTATVEQIFHLLREEIRKNYNKLLTSTTKIIMEVLREGVLEEVRDVMRTVESVKYKLGNLERTVREIEERLEEEEEEEDEDE